jgi:signal transduction histidine kinase
MLGIAAAGHSQSLPVRNLAVLVDPKGVETIDTVSAALAQKAFRSIPGNLSAGYTRDVHWLRFTVQVPTSDEWWLEVEPPFLDDLRLFEPGPAGFIEHRAGDTLPFTSRQEDYRGFIFKLKVPDTAPRTFYLRLQTSSTSMASLQLWRADRFAGAKHTEYAILGIHFGVIVLVLMLNLLLWVALRDSLFGWFSLHTLGSLLVFLAASGLIAQYLLRDSPHLADASVGAALFFLVASSAPFSRRMAGVDRDQPRLLWVFRIQATLPLGMMLSLATGHYFQEAARIVMLLWLPLSLLMLYLSFRLWRQGRAEGMYMLVANVTALAGSVASTLAVLGFMQDDLFTLNFRLFSLLGHTLALQFALSARFQVMHAERHKATEQFQAAEQDAAWAREAHAEQGRFIAMLSHELKTPLAVIDSAAQTLARIDRSNNAEVGRRHERIRRGVSRIDHLVEQFLTTDRVDADGINVQRCPVNVRKLLGMVADTSPDGAERLHLTAPASLMLVADAALLRVAVGNLVDNALKYTPRDSNVHVSALPQDESGVPGVEIMVSDEGPGIAPALRDQVFFRYSRGENVGHVSGAGLGLYLVRRIAELHGGQVSLLPHSAGAVFRLWLPTGVVGLNMNQHHRGLPGESIPIEADNQAVVAPASPSLLVWVPIERRRGKGTA